MKNPLPVIIFLLMLTGFNNVFAQAPVITYASPQTYSPGTAIAPLSPVNTGGAVATVPIVSTFAGNGNAGAVDGTGNAAEFNLPQGVAVDAAGNVYVADQGNNLIRKITPAGVVTTIAGANIPSNDVNGQGTAARFNSPGSIAVDGSGYIYVTDAEAIREIIPGGYVATLNANFGSTQISADAAGNIYIAAGQVWKLNPFGVVSMVAPQNSCFNPFYVTVDASGNVYASDSSDDLIFKITPAGVVTTFAGNCNNAVSSGTPCGNCQGGFKNGQGTSAFFQTPLGLAVDASGNAYVADFSNQAIRKINPAGLVTTYAGGTAGILSGPVNVAVDAANNVYVVDGNTIKKIAPAAYTISPALPAGLIFDSTTGTISGTPTVTSQATDYTIKAYNAGGVGTAIVNITVAPNANNANLKNLTISSGTLNPAFAGATTNYTATVSNPTASITVTPTASDPAAKVTVNGKTLVSGSLSANLPLLVGPNIITIVVTENVTTSKTYTVNVTRLASDYAYLANLQLTSGKLNPAFASTTLRYTAGVSRTTFSIAVTPITVYAFETVTVNGAEVPSGTVSPPVSLNNGVNNISIVVTAQNGINIKTYALVVTKEPAAMTADVKDAANNGEFTIDEITIHQAVSPNGDGVNDVLTIDNIANYPDNSLTLINMRGTAIYEISGYDNLTRAFNGHSNITGALQEPGTYFYVLDYWANGELKRKTGYFLLKY